jgi:hypothetical protein
MARRRVHDEEEVASISDTYNENISDFSSSDGDYEISDADDGTCDSKMGATQVSNRLEVTEYHQVLNGELSLLNIFIFFWPGFVGSTGNHIEWE